MANKVRIIDKSGLFHRLSTNALDGALARMAKDVKQIAKITVPFKTGNLQKSIQDEKRGFLKHRVIADEVYAGYQERGKRLDGSRVVRKYTTPGTGKRYLEKAGDNVTKDIVNFFKQAAKKVRI